MKKRLVALVLAAALALALAPAARAASFGEGVSFEGAPSYISEFPTAFRDNGGPLSPYGSHFGVKAEVRSREFAGVLHYACATGRNVLDYSRTGLVGTTSVRFMREDGFEIKEAKSRDIRFEYFGWTESARFDRFTAKAYVQFLGLDRYAVSVAVTNLSPFPLDLAPALHFSKNGQRLDVDKLSGDRNILLRCSVQPTFVPGESFLAVLPSLGAGTGIGDKSGDCRMSCGGLSIPPGETRTFWFNFAYSADSRDEALSLLKKSEAEFREPEAEWNRMLAWREAFFDALPAPHLADDDAADLELYHMAATALENALYAPRGKMTLWACVPTKVHYNWFWLWDSGFQALGYGEYRPEEARQVIDSVFKMQEKNGFIAHMEDENEKGITPHSQPPVFGFSVPRILERWPDHPGYDVFRKDMYEKGERFIGWWKKARDVNRNGLFEYLSQDEGGWDNSPRADYVPRLLWISYYGTLGEMIGSRVKPLDNVDLNSWMYLYYEALADWAAEMDKPAEAKKWRNEADALARRIDETLWDEEAGAWFDTYTWMPFGKPTPFRVLTPHIWFPAFAGATRDEKKAREVIERHLLNTDEFFGKYPMPIVAYNDPYYDLTKPGWYSSIWMVTAYSGLEALFKFGYEDEAEELKRRLLTMMADQDGVKGIFETYCPEAGKYKNAHSTGGYNSFQFGWSSAFTMEMLLDRHQRERFVFADTRRIAGFIRKAPEFESRSPFYRVEAAMEVPRVTLEADEPLLSAKVIKVRLDDPHQKLGGQGFKIWIRDQAFNLDLGREYQLDI